MKKQDIVSYFAPMPFGRKIIIGFTFLAMIACGLPWFFESRSYSALNYFPFFGYSLLFFLVMVFYTVFREHVKKESTIGTVSNRTIIMIGLLLSLYTTVLYTVVFYHLLEYNIDSSIKMGGSICFIATGMALLGMMLSWNYAPKKEVNAFANPPIISPDKILLKPERTFIANHHE